MNRFSMPWTDLVAIHTRRPCNPAVCETFCGLGRRRRRRLLRRCIEREEGVFVFSLEVRSGIGCHDTMILGFAMFSARG